MARIFGPLQQQQCANDLMLTLQPFKQKHVLCLLSSSISFSEILDISHLKG